MIPGHIVEYLEENNIPYSELRHVWAISAQDLAAALHVSGHRLAKTLVVEVDGQMCLVAIPASERLDLERLTEQLGANRARFVPEDEFAPRFEDCEVGSEPPFGHLYGMPVLVDKRLADQDLIVVRGGSHREALEMSFSDYERMELPRTF